MFAYSIGYYGYETRELLTLSKKLEQENVQLKTQVDLLTAVAKDQYEVQGKIIEGLNPLLEDYYKKKETF